MKCKRALLLVCSLAMPLVAGAGGVWESIKKGVGDAADTVGDVAD